MPMIPLSIVLALMLGYFLLIELTRPSPRNRFACVFLILVMVQFTIVGIRFGYGVEVFGEIFPMTAALIGLLAFLSFQNPANLNENPLWPALLHLVPLSVALLLTLFAPNFIDLAQGLFTFFYAVALTLLGLRERDTFPWVDFNRREYVRRALWCVVALAFMSAITDFVIAVDDQQTQGANIPGIVGWTSIIAALLFTSFIVWQKRSENRPEVATDVRMKPVDSNAEVKLLAQLDNLIAATQLYLDPDLNLNRMARKLGVPSRQISVAINRQRSVNVSQFINGLRIDEACQLLRETNLSVTRVMLQSGFITKSNFNRDFSRRMGSSPSVWRAGFVG